MDFKDFCFFKLTFELRIAALESPSVCYLSPYFRFYSEKEVYGEQVRKIYFLCVLTAVYIIPFIVTISAYTAILHTLFRQFYKLRNTESRQSQGEERGNHVSNRGLIPRARVKVSEVLHL